MTTPPFLKKNDKVALVCTARKISIEELQPALQLLKNWGLQVEIGKSIGAAHHQFGGNDDERLSDLQYYLDDKNIKAILIARGGYGTARIIDRLNFKKFIKYPKWIVGFSDITALLNHVVQNSKVETLHAPMPINFSSLSDTALKCFKNALFGNLKEYSFSASENNITGQAKGQLIGGNLSVIYSLAGSISELNTKNKILFLEDIDEYYYHIDRMMLQLDRAGKLKKLKGLMIGAFTDVRDNIVPFGLNVEQIILQYASKYHFPVAFNIPAGHISNQHALILGRKIILSVSKNNTKVVF